MNLTSYIRSYECPQETVEGAIKLFEMCKDMDFVVPGKVGMGDVDKTIKDSEDVYLESLPMFPLHEFGMDLQITVAVSSVNVACISRLGISVLKFLSFFSSHSELKYCVLVDFGNFFLKKTSL